MSRAHAARAAHAARHRLRAGQPAAGAASECRRAGRSVAGRQRARGAVSTARPTREWLKRAARGLHRARHRADLRRGVRRLPPRARRRAGIFRRAGGSRHLRQDARRRVAGRRGLRPQRADEALPRRPAGRHLLRARHVQFASVRDGARCTSSCTRLDTAEIRALYVDLDAIWNARAARLNARLRERGAAGAGREPVVDLDRLLHAAVALQLDAPVLSARRRPRAELDRHRPADLQPQLHRCGFRGGGRAFRRRRRGDAAATAGGGPTPGADQQDDQARDPARRSR